MRNKLMRWLAGLLPGVRLRGGPAVVLSDAEVLSALAVDGGHPVLAAVQELSRRAEADARDLARQNVKDHFETAYYLGAEWALENLRDYVESTRLEALRLSAERDSGGV